MYHISKSENVKAPNTQQEYNLKSIDTRIKHLVLSKGQTLCNISYINNRIAHFC